MQTPRVTITALMFALLSVPCFAAAAGMTLSGDPPTTAVVGEVYRFLPVTTNAVGPIVFRYRNRPRWLKISYAGGLMMGTPKRAGVYANIRIRAWDDSQHVVKLPPFTITVRAAGQPPTTLKISGTPATTAAVGEYYSFTPTVLASAGCVPQYSVLGKPAWARFNSGSGRLSGIPITSDVAPDVVISVSCNEMTAALPAFMLTVAPAVAGPETARTAYLSWSRPDQNTDGSPLTNLAGYLVRYGTGAAPMGNRIFIGSPSSTNAEIGGLAPGEWHFEIAAINTANTASRFSLKVSKTVQ